MNFQNSKQLTLDKLRTMKEMVSTSSRNQVPLLYMMDQDNLFIENTPRCYFAAGIHSYAVIGEYVFFYENENLILCLHMIDDWREVNATLTLMVDHESANYEELVELYAGHSVTSTRPVDRLANRSRLALVAQ